MRRAGQSIPPVPDGVSTVVELPAGDFPLYRHPPWTAAFPWLVQGTTGRGADALDMGLFGAVPTGVAHERWRRLRAFTAMPSAVHARQVHGAGVAWHEHPEAGLTVGDDLDGHATGTPGVLLTVSVADCVPILLVSPVPRAVAVLHGGWRGIAAGILEAGIDALIARAGTAPARLCLHCGPAICGECYEVGPEVPTALGMSVPAGKVRLDLRAVIAERALRAGVPAERISISGHCTRCGAGLFWSHRGGCRERQLGLAGIRP